MKELDANELYRLRTAGESKDIEYKPKSGLKDKPEILRQMTAFANRAGGTLLFGVSDDGSIEGATIDTDEHVQKVSSLVRDKTSPIVDFLPLFYRGPDGDVLAFWVFKRTGIPCAVIDRKQHEIEARKYFVRTNCGVRMMDDKTLEWLFLHQDDPAINESFRACVQYSREDISLSVWPEHPLLLAPLEMLNIFHALTDEQRQLLKSHESGNMGTFLAEVMPHAFLAHLSSVYRQSWKVEVRRTGNMISWSPTQAVSEQLDLEQLFVPSHAGLLHKLSFDVSKIYLRSKTLSLPPGTSVQVTMDESESRWPSSCATLRKDGVFDISFRITPFTWSVGAAPGHPFGSTLGGLHRLTEQIELQEQVANVSLDVELIGIFDFPDEPCDEIGEYFEWAQQLVAEIRIQWDWDRVVSSLPPGILYSIDRDVREILKHVKRAG